MGSWDFYINIKIVSNDSKTLLQEYKTIFYNNQLFIMELFNNV